MTVTPSAAASLAIEAVVAFITALQDEFAQEKTLVIVHGRNRTQTEKLANDILAQSGHA
ncbi:hypothetical protein [Caballeronia sp. 15711]|uniref:hypothetical protein n=1 Tax=Caballeronia sp. 15711 TaxID=3391029 RepID=UPI0039E2896B